MTKSGSHGLDDKLVHLLPHTDICVVYRGLRASVKPIKTT